MIRFVLPIVVFVGLLVLLYNGLTIDPHRVPSPFIGKPAPHLDLVSLDFPDQRVKTSKMLGKPWVLNVFASWCETCSEESPQVAELSQHVLLIGMDKQDHEVNVRRWLERHGNPYDMILIDKDGKTSINWGVYAVPESFIIDKKGIIRYKVIGAITETALRKTILPLIKKLNAEPA
ncbi:MAG: DsbE family thiol:disulfide interchange protein [Gammaproteobacteria bacterium]|jgi:cytochrome c biogenesis protein CcmG, thiol:disulfide interchange protein DsbE